MGIVIDGLEMPKENERLEIVINSDGKVTYSLDLNCKQIAIAHSPKVGHWVAVENGNDGDMKCSQCGCYHHVWEAYGYYCQHCGAKMNEVEYGD